jgi:hypothetical protein
MKRKIAAVVLGTALALGALAGPAAANNGKGNGAVGCTLANSTEYKNPAEMLKALSERDGHFQDTVDLFPAHFESVGDLIDQKCGA